VPHSRIATPTKRKSRDGEIGHLNTCYELLAETKSYTNAAGCARSAWRWHLHGKVIADLLPHVIYLQLGFIELIHRIASVAMLLHSETGKQRSHRVTPYEGCSGLGSMTLDVRSLLTWPV
jgi:hypothetical protein